jgi:hypothetical protein
MCVFARSSSIHSRGAQQGGTISAMGMLSTLDPAQLRGP